MLLLPTLALAHPGDLDTGFGTAGMVITDFKTDEFGDGVVVAKDGAIYVGASVDRDGANPDCALLRYTAKGVLDTHWGTGGRVVTDFGGSDEVYRIALQRDGKIVMAGNTLQLAPPHNDAFALARYLPNGDLDPSFGTGGKVIDTTGDPHEELQALAIQGDGKIVVAGVTRTDDPGATPKAVVARFLSSGTPDGSFGSGGRMINDFGSREPVFDALAIQKDGKILASGLILSGTQLHFLVARYLKNGQLDTHFGSGGFVTAFTDNPSVGNGMALQSDGKIVVVGTVDTTPGQLLGLARFTKDGKLDSSFGDGSGGGPGLVTVSLLKDSPGNAVAIQSDGKIVVAGGAVDASHHRNFGVTRFTKKGRLDASFGTGGKVITPIAQDGDGEALAFQRDHKIVVAGGAFNGTDFDVALARYRAR